MMAKNLESLSFHGFTVESILANLAFTSLPRNIKVAEIFSGVGSIYKAAKKKKLEAVEYDNKRPGAISADAEDFLSEEGFINAIKILMQVEEGGVYFLAPWCGPWMFLNKSNTKRTKSNNYWGDEANSSVQQSNNMMTGVVILMQAAAARKVLPGMENPVKSYVWHWPPMVAVIEKLGLTSVTTFRCGFDRTKPPRIWKKYRIVAKGSWVQKLFRKCPCSGDHLKTSKIEWRHGKKRCTGIKKRLAISGQYPPAMGTAFVAAWQKFDPAKEAKRVQKKVMKKKATSMKKKGTVMKKKGTVMKKKANAKKQKNMMPKKHRTKKTQEKATVEKSAAGPSWLLPACSTNASEKRKAPPKPNVEVKAPKPSWMQPKVA
eukprot:Skav213220  [mRNA]  locus=scaffold369:39750:40871:+ [translate_table: standard]